MTKCKGCGVTLQTEFPGQPGYTPKAGSTYCQRCFRLIHYDDLTMSMKKGIDPDEVVEKIAGMDALILWVVDLFDFEAGMISGINRKLSGHDIIMAATKRDLLPATVGSEKLADFVFARLKEQGITIRELILVSANSDEGLNDIREAVAEYSNGRPVVVMGRANSGKSTLLNRLMKDNALTMSRYPGTTLDFNEIEIDGYRYIDTPGIEIDHSLLMDVEEKDLKTISLASTVKPVVFQLRGNQSFAVGGLVRLDLSGCEKASCVWYCSDRLQIHRSKLENADELWQKHYGGMLSPVGEQKDFVKYSRRKNDEKMDVVIDGLGWACISGKVENVTVHVPKGIGVTFRKAML